jgi:hypothetical protein
MVNEDGPGRDLMAFGCPSTTSERLRMPGSSSGATLAERLGIERLVDETPTR